MLHLPSKVTHNSKEILTSHNSETQELIEKEVKNVLYELEQANPLHIQDLQLSIISCSDPVVLSSS